MNLHAVIVVTDCDGFVYTIAARLQDGQGSTGGVMDYGMKLYNGVYQFNTKYRKDQVCASIKENFDDYCLPRNLVYEVELETTTTAPSTTPTTTYNQECGDMYITGQGVFEVPEEQNSCYPFDQVCDVPTYCSGNRDCADCGTCVLELIKAEECECLDGSTSCLYCVDCQFTEGRDCSPEAMCKPGVACGEQCTSTCAVNEYVLSSNCVPCPDGMEHPGGTDPDGGNTFCTAIICTDNQHVVSNTCQACLPGTTRYQDQAAPDDATGDNTDCYPTICKVFEQVVDHVCTACPAGTKNEMGNDDASAAPNSNTCTAIICGENEYVNTNNACVT